MVESTNTTVWTVAVGGAFAFATLVWNTYVTDRAAKRADAAAERAAIKLADVHATTLETKRLVDGPLGTLMTKNAQLERELSNASPNSAAQRQAAEAAELAARNHEAEIKKAG